MVYKNRIKCNGHRYSIDIFKEFEETTITIDDREKIKITIEPNFNKNNHINKLNNLTTLMKYHRYVSKENKDPGSKLIMDSKEMDQNYHPIEKRKKYIGALTLLLINGIDYLLDINNYDYIITAPVYFISSPPKNNDIMKYREFCFLSTVESEFNVSAIHHLLRKKTETKIKEYDSFKTKFEFSMKNYEVFIESVDLDNKKILIIDDVCTTGATGESIATKIKRKWKVNTVDMIAIAQTKNY